MKKIENILHKKYADILQAYALSAGASDEASFISAFSSNANNIIQVMIRFKDRNVRNVSVFDIGEDLRNEFNNMPEIIKYDISYSTAMENFGGSNTVDIKLFGYNLEHSLNYAKLLSNKIKKEITGARDVNISQDNEKSELKLVFNEQKILQIGLNTAMIASTLRNYLTGFTATKYKEDGKEYDVIFRLNNKVRNNIETFKNIAIKTPVGSKVYLVDIASIVEEPSLPVIEHENKQRVIKISVKPEKISLNKLAKNIENLISHNPTPSDVDVVVGGAYQDQQESFRDIILLMVIATILVYLTMAAQFESFVMPIIIMVSIPFAFSGVFIALWLTNTPFSINSLLGAFMLIGIAVKNAIILVDFTNLLRERGYNLFDAIVEAGRSRLRPILMTATTTILGMLPLAFSTGEGSEQWAPIGISVIGGLIFSTIVSLVIIPVAYYVFVRTGSRLKIRKKFQSEFTILNNVLKK